MRLRSSRTSNSPDIEAHEHIQESPDPCQTCVPLLSSDSHIAYKKQTYASEEEHKLFKVDTSEFNGSNIDDTASPHSSYQSSSDDSDGDYIMEEGTVLHDHAETEATFQKRKLSAASIAIADIKYDISESVEYLGIADEAKYNTRKRQKSLDNKTRKQRTDLELDTISEGDQDVNLDNKKSKEEMIEEETEYERNYSGVKTRSKSQQVSQSNSIQGLTDYKSVGKRESDNQQAESCGMITRRKSKSVETNKSYNVIKTKSSNPVKKSPKVERKQPTRAKRPYPPIPSIVNTRSISKEPEPIVKEEETDESPLEILEGGQQIQIKDLVVLDTVLGEGQIGTVNLAKYKNLLVACKSKRSRTKREPFYFQIQRELKFAAKLSVCRNINRYIGWIYCERSKVEPDVNDKYGVMKLYVIQRYVANGDARSYLDKRGKHASLSKMYDKWLRRILESTFQPAEVLQASICLFSALADAHELGIGIVDLKLENFLVRNTNHVCDCVTNLSIG